MPNYTVKTSGLMQADHDAFMTQKREGGFIKHLYAERRVILNTGNAIVTFIY